MAQGISWLTAHDHNQAMAWPWPGHVWAMGWLLPGRGMCCHVPVVPRSYLAIAHVVFLGALLLVHGLIHDFLSAAGLAGFITLQLMLSK